jgi:hypothetical protein
MDPDVVAKLKAFNLASITSGLQTVAATWARLCVDELPVRGTTLAALQAEYRDLLDALPVCTSDEIEAVLRVYARALALKREDGTATQYRFVAHHMRSWTDPGGLRWSDRDAAAEWLAGVCRPTGSLVTRFSTACVLYVISHLQLGVDWPTLTQEFQAQLATPALHHDLITPQGVLLLAPMIRAHSRWIASLVEGRKAPPDDSDDWYTGSAYGDEPAATTWAGVAGH